MIDELNQRPNDETPEQPPVGPENEGETPEGIEPLSEMEQLQQALAEAQATADDYLDKYRRGAAEFANYRKRIERERELQRVRITMDVLRKVLPALDDLDRAAENVPPEAAGLGWVEGVVMINHKLESVLAQFGVSTIEALGQPFDPNYHEAMMQLPSEEYPEGHVAQVVQRGYVLGKEVLRPSRVGVSLGPGPATGDDTE